MPNLLARLRIDREGLAVERVEEDAPVGVGGAAIDDVAARDALRRRRRLRLELPLRRAVEAERVEDVRVGRHHEHRAVGDDRRGLLTAQHAERERPGDLQILRVSRVDLVEAAVAHPRRVLAGQRPLPVIVRGVRPRRRDQQVRREHRGHAGSPPHPFASGVVALGRRTAPRDGNIERGGRGSTPEGAPQMGSDLTWITLTAPSRARLP